MDLSKYRNKLIGSEDERAVSPVIGVILMVAITVILAAVIAAFVLDMGDSMGNTAPTASIDSGVNSDWDSANSGDVELFYLTHQSGDAIDGEDIRVVIRDADSSAAVATLDSTDWTDDDGTDSPANEVSLALDGETGPDISSETFGGGSTLTITVSEDHADISNDDVFDVQLIHVPSETTIGSHELTA